VFQSCNLSNIPLVPEEEVSAYDAGQTRVKGEEARLKAFLTEQKKQLAEREVHRIPEYLEALWKLQHPKAGAAAALPKELAEQGKLREAALRKWSELLDAKNRGKLPALAPWFQLAGAGGEVPPQLAAAAALVQKQVQAALDERDGKPVSAAAPPKGEAKFVSPVLTPKQRFVEVDVDVTGAAQLYLVVTDGGDGISSDHADWGEPRLVGPGGERKLTELPWRSARSSYGTTRLHTNFSGAPLVLGGRRLEYGIGTHASSEVVYDLPEGCNRFKATVGLDGQAVGSVQFRVYFAPPSDIPTGDLPKAKVSPQTQELLTAVLGDKGALSVADD
jgi:hypothetical protein